ncbi:MAG: hypothetical protein WCZ18_03865 [Ottowia sp.]|nr:hypothetical protein [Ottowia sp.]
MLRRTQKRPTPVYAWMLALAAAAALLLAAAPAAAQVTRLFPHDAERGHITFEPQSRLVRVDGKPERLGPGVQVRDERGRAPPLGTLAGQTLLAHYVRDASGAIFRIWILTPKEAGRPAPGKSARKGWDDPEPFRYLN